MGPTKVIITVIFQTRTGPHPMLGMALDVQLDPLQFFSIMSKETYSQPINRFLEVLQSFTVTNENNFIVDPC